MHELASDLPCECVHFLAYDFAGPHWSMLYDTPTFMGWQLEHIESELERIYRWHRRMLQTFQHGTRANTERPRRWLLKSPGHLQTLPQLFAEYPDAKVIHTHRDPRRFIASLVSLLGRAALHPQRRRERRSRSGPLMELTYQMFLEQVIDQRESGAIPNAQIVDSHFLDLMADPVASLAPALRRARDGVARRVTTASCATTSRRSRRESTARTGTRSRTSGLDEASVRATFARYVEHYGITEE